MTGRFVVVEERPEQRTRTIVAEYHLDRASVPVIDRELVEEAVGGWSVYGDLKTISEVHLGDVVLVRPAPDAAGLLTLITSALVGAQRVVQPDGTVIVTGTTADGIPILPITLPAEATTPVVVSAPRLTAESAALTRALADRGTALAERDAAAQRVLELEAALADAARKA